jgi:nicotinamide mononucleotide adenylyltransferase
MKECNIFIGRFQPLTVGHMKCIIKSYTENRLKTVLFMIDVPEDKTDDKHPFPSDMLIDMYKNIIDGYDCLIDIIKIKLS